jgi:hypothetical protein
MRGRLIELIQRLALSDEPCPEGLFEWADTIADHLLSEGVIVPPCKVGDITYIFDYEVNNHLEVKFRGIKPSIVEAITIEDDGLWIENKRAKYHISSVGDLIFLTRKEAQMKLKENSNACNN